MCFVNIFKELKRFGKGRKTFQPQAFTENFSKCYSYAVIWKPVPYTPGVLSVFKTDPFQLAWFSWFSYASLVSCFVFWCGKSGRVLVQLRTYACNMSQRWSRTRSAAVDSTLFAGAGPGVGNLNKNWRWSISEIRAVWKAVGPPPQKSRWGPLVSSLTSRSHNFTKYCYCVRTSAILFRN